LVNETADRRRRVRGGNSNGERTDKRAERHEPPHEDTSLFASISCKIENGLRTPRTVGNIYPPVKEEVRHPFVKIP
jgi:hypothetical protein